MTPASASKIGQLFCRLIVPGWVLTGALLKLWEANPQNLPQETILMAATSLGIPLDYLFATLIGLEFVAVAVMVTLLRQARLVGALVLGVSCMVQFGELVLGNAVSCGCMGAYSLAPWMIILINGTLLTAVLIFDPAMFCRARPARWPRAVALCLVAGGFYMSFRTIILEPSKTNDTAKEAPAQVNRPLASHPLSKLPD